MLQAKLTPQIGACPVGLFGKSKKAAIGMPIQPREKQSIRPVDLPTGSRSSRCDGNYNDPDNKIKRDIGKPYTNGYAKRGSASGKESGSTSASATSALAPGERKRQRERQR